VIHFLSFLENLDLLLFLLYSVFYVCLSDEEVLYEELDSLEVHMLVTLHLQDNIKSILKCLAFNVEFHAEFNAQLASLWTLQCLISICKLVGTSQSHAAS
jgi:hypothetical protein